jgi:acyl carrier protein
MTDRLHNVVAQIFGAPIEQVTDEDGPDTIESWDSLAHINLVLTLEAEFSISLSPDDAAEMLSVGLIRQILWEKGVTKSGFVTP